MDFLWFRKINSWDLLTGKFQVVEFEILFLRVKRLIQTKIWGLIEKCKKRFVFEDP